MTVIWKKANVRTTGNCRVVTIPKKFAKNKDEVFAIFVDVNNNEAISDLLRAVR